MKILSVFHLDAEHFVFICAVEAIKLLSEAGPGHAVGRAIELSRGEAVEPVGGGADGVHLHSGGQVDALRGVSHCEGLGYCGHCGCSAVGGEAEDIVLVFNGLLCRGGCETCGQGPHGGLAPVEGVGGHLVDVDLHLICAACLAVVRHYLQPCGAVGEVHRVVGMVEEVDGGVALLAHNAVGDIDLAGRLSADIHLKARYFRAHWERVGVVYRGVHQVDGKIHRVEPDKDAVVFGE